MYFRLFYLLLTFSSTLQRCLTLGGGGCSIFAATRGYSLSRVAYTPERVHVHATNSSSLVSLFTRNLSMGLDSCS